MTTTPIEYDDRTVGLGHQAGKSAADAVDLTADTYLTAHSLALAGDPDLYDLIPEPAWLSGEWADAPTPASLKATIGMTDEEWEPGGDVICEVYEQAANEAFWGAIEARRFALGLHCGDGWAQALLDEQNDRAAASPLGDKRYWLARGDDPQDWPETGGQA
jgi:hypothetical protein